MRVQGRGYVTSAQNKDEEAPVGTIWVDSIFSPIQRVRYGVENVRVGDRTDYEQLELEIWTDGSMHPRDAMGYASKIFKELQDDLMLIHLDKSNRQGYIHRRIGRHGRG